MDTELNVQPTSIVEKHWDGGWENLAWLEDQKNKLEQSRADIDTKIAAAITAIDSQKAVLQGFLDGIENEKARTVTDMTIKPEQVIVDAPAGISSEQYATQHYTDVQGGVHSVAEDALAANEAYQADSRS